MWADHAWFPWALGAAVFAALTAIFAKVGVEDVDPDLATLIRTGVVFVALATLVVAAGKWSSPAALSRKALVFLVLSGLATGASWLCYFRALKLGDASRVAPVDKFSPGAWAAETQAAAASRFRPSFPLLLVA